MKARLARFALPAVAGAVVLSSCIVGGDSGEDRDARPTRTEGELVVALSMPAPGFQVGVVKGREVVLAKGFEVDLAEELGRELGVTRVRFVNEARFETLLAPAGKDWDLALAEITDTPARRERADFSTSYLRADQGVLMRSGVPAVTSIAALRGLRLCAERNTTSAELVADTIAPTRKPRLVDDPSALVSALFSARCDAIVADAPTLGVARKEAPLRYGELAGVIRTDESYAAVLERDNPLRAAVDGALARLQENGTTERLQRKWLTLDVSELPALE